MTLEFDVPADIGTESAGGSIGGGADSSDVTTVFAVAAIGDTAVEREQKADVDTNNEFRLPALGIVLVVVGTVGAMVGGWAGSELSGGLAAEVAAEVRAGLSCGFNGGSCEV